MIRNSQTRKCRVGYHAVFVSGNILTHPIFTLTVFCIPTIRTRRQSARKLHEDEEFCLYRVFVLTKGVEAFKAACKDRRFTVRTVDFANADAKQEQERRAAFEQDKNAQLASLIKWAKAAYADLFISWMHVKGIRVFVESVLRYGLPVDFSAFVLKPAHGKEKRLRQALGELYAHLGGSHLAVRYLPRTHARSLIASV